MGINFISDWWPLICWVLVSAVAYGRLSERVDNNKDDHQKLSLRIDDYATVPRVALAECDRRMGDCNRLNLSKFDAGTREFDEIKGAMVELTRRHAETEKANEERHRELMNILLEKN